MSRRRAVAAAIGAAVVGGFGFAVISVADADQAPPLGDVGAVSFHEDVRGILQANCQACHRSGGVAPFSLESFEDAYAMRHAVRDAVAARRMPPWFASPEVGSWANDRSLSEEERLRLLAWVESGAPEGDPTAAPPARTWPENWSIGEPDTVVRIPRPITVPEEGVIPYRYVYVETDFPEDRWIQAMQIRPTAPAVVHHVLVLIEEPLEETGDALPFEAPGQEAPHPDFGLGLDGFFAAHVPGHFGVRYPEGQAKRLPRGATLKFQIHYMPNGTTTEDRTELALVFADEPPEYMVDTDAAMSLQFVIPPGARDHEVTAVHRFNEPVALLGFLPHMHLRGSAFRYELHHPDGRRETILDVPHYDFDWQEEYIFAEPLEVEAGSWLRATGWFDNSADNPFNPDPTATVRFGEQTWEEMMNGYFHYIVPNPEFEPPDARLDNQES